MPQPTRILGGFRTIQGAKLAAARLTVEGVPPSRVSVVMPDCQVARLWPPQRPGEMSDDIGALLSVTSPDKNTRTIAQRTLESSGALLLETIQDDEAPER